MSTHVEQGIAQQRLEGWVDEGCQARAYEHHADDPADAADHIVRNEFAVIHTGNTGHHGREGAYDRHEACEHNRLAAVPFIKRMRLEEMLSVEEPRALALEYF